MAKKEFPIDFDPFIGTLTNSMKMLISSFPGGQEFYVTLQKLAEYFGGGTGSGDVSFDAESMGVTYAVGDIALGGEIVKILSLSDFQTAGLPELYDPNMQQGIVAAFDAAVEKPWSPQLTTVPDLVSGWFLTGIANTAKIIAVFGDGDYAAKYCSDLVIGEYSDYYMGALWEMLFGVAESPNCPVNDIWISQEHATSTSFGRSIKKPLEQNEFVKTELHTVVPLRFFSVPKATPLRDGEIALFSGTDGKYIKGSGKLLSEIGGGTSGLSAYQIAVNNGFIGTEIEWLASLQGEDGIIGVNGKSAYELAVIGGFVGTEAEWLASLHGTNGANGTSVPVNVTFFKTSANGVVPLIAWSWITNLVASQVILHYSDDISVKIGETTYNKTTLIGIALPAGTAITDLDMTITTGYNSGQVTIIFTQA